MSRRESLGTMLHKYLFLLIRIYKRLVQGSKRECNVVRVVVKEAGEVHVQCVPLTHLSDCVATVPSWVEETATHYMGEDRILVDLIGRQRIRTAVTVEHKAVCCPYQERPTVINDVIQVCMQVGGK